jgi:hypothetical protein
MLGRCRCLLVVVLVEKGIERAVGEEMAVGSLFDNGSVLDDEDYVGVSDSGQPVGDHNKDLFGALFSIVA